MEKSELKKFLSQYEISNTNAYALGVFQPGITVYNQQLRSLNILHAMVQTNTITANDKIAVIGGGIAGLTFAAGALKLGFSIDLFERSQILIPYQYGCETRRIHPHFYSWPESLTEYPYCDLPLFNWSHETASTVAKNIYDTFRAIAIDNSTKYKEYRGTKLGKADITWGKSKTTIEFDSGKGQRINSYNKVIVATGFGIEKRIELDIKSPAKQTTTTCLSYWRNDDFEQASLTNDLTTTYVISGTGDGALMDLFRLKLRGFTVKLILDKLKIESQKYKELKALLREIRTRYNQLSVKKRQKDNTFLYEEFEVLKKSNHLKALSKILRKLLRKDTNVIIHHRNLSIQQLFDLRRASLFNNLLAYVMLSKSYCGFKRFEFEAHYAPWVTETLFSNEDEESALKKVNEKNNQQIASLFRALKQKYPNWIDEEKLKIIIRHGTEVEDSLEHIGIKSNQIKKLKEKQLKDLSSNHLISIWEPGWWNQGTLKESQEPIEFVEPELNLVCNSFASSLSAAIDQFSNYKAHFRVVLHRIIKKSDRPFYQQVSHYYGDSKNTRLLRPVGRIFPLEIGLVGYACKTGRSLLLEKTDKVSDYARTWNALMTKEEKRMEKKYSDFKNNQFTTDNHQSSETLFACPIVYEQGSKYFPIFCLYIDSSDLNLKDKKLLGLVFSVMQGFVKLFDRAASDEQKIIYVEDLFDSLFQIDPSFKDQKYNEIIEGSKSFSVVDEYEAFKPQMLFKNLTPNFISIRF